MRVLHAISGLDPENGGPTFALAGLARAQVRAGLEVTVIATWQIPSGFPVADALRADGVKVIHIGQAHGKLSRHPQLRAAVDDAVSLADIVHIHALWEEIQHQAARACQRRGVPYVITPHGMLSPWSMGSGSKINRWGKRFYLWMRLNRNLRRAAALHFTTVSERDLAAATLAIGPDELAGRSIIEGIGLDWTEFDPLPPAGGFRADYPQLQGRPLMLFLSRLSPQKGLDVLIEAFARFIARDTSGVMLAVVGADYDGHQRLIQQQVQRLGLQERVVFTGMLLGPRRIGALVDADLFVLASRHENFGIVVAEAMACAKPVLISQNVNIWKEILAAGAGAAVENTPELFAAEMARWMADEALRHRAGQAGQRHARAHYEWNAIARHWVEHYRALIR